MEVARDRYPTGLARDHGQERGSHLPKLGLTAASLLADPVAALRKQLTDALQFSDSQTDKKNQVLHLDRPYNLYLVHDQAELYLETIATAPFERQLYRPLIHLLQSEAGTMLADLGPNIDLIDLGPGLPDKSLPLVDFLDSSSRGFRYIPVDISSHFLSLTTSYFRYRRFPILPLQVLFEELPSVLHNDPRFLPDRIRVVNIGLTFNNYQPTEIIPLMHNIMGPFGIGVLATESIDLTDPNDILVPYVTSDADTFNFRMLALLGFERADFEYYAVLNGDCVNMGFQAVNHIVLGSGHSIAPGVRIQTSFSYRYRLTSLHNLLTTTFSEVRWFAQEGKRVCAFRIRGGA